jgi:Ca-activated chloride channel family protein
MNVDDLPESILRTKDGKAMPLERMSIQGALRDYAAEITVEQHYRNPRSTNIEAVYTFPLPVGAVLLDLELQLGDRRLTGQVVEKKAAEARYEDAVTDGDTAVMIEVTGPGLYTLNFGNLMARETAVIRYRYALLLNWQGDRVRFILPTTIAPRYGNPAKAGLAPHQVPETSLLVEYPLDLRLSIQGRLADAEISCPSHMITKSRDEKGVSVVLGSPAVLDRDFVLTLRNSPENSACVFAREDGGKVLLASLRIPPLPKREEKPLRLKVVIDCSGSMAGMSIAQARKASLEILGQLRPGDRFNFTLFGSSVQHLWPDLVPAEARYISLAAKQLEELDANLGGTETAHALRAVYALGDKQAGALARFKNHDSQLDRKGVKEPAPQVLLITDGEVWEYKEIVKEAITSHHRVFTVGVGLSVAEGLVGELAKQTGGACELVSPQEGMTERILAQFHRLRQPRVTLKGIKLGQKPDWFTPLSKTMFAGDTVHVYAGISGEVPDTVSMGTADDEGNVTHVEAAVVTTDWRELPRMAAAARIASPKTAEQDKLQLALDYQLLTGQTNLLIVAERADKAENLPELAKVAHMLAAGWGGTGVIAEGISNCISSSADFSCSYELSSPIARSPRVRNSRSQKLSYIGVSDSYAIPAFLRKNTDFEEAPSTTVIFDAEGHITRTKLHGDTPRHFLANLLAGLPPDMQNPDVLPKAIEVLEDFGLPAEIATALRELSAEGWTERIIVAAFLMALTQIKSLAGEFPREFSRLIFAHWKRSGADQAMLDNIGKLIESALPSDWMFEMQVEEAVPADI